MQSYEHCKLSGLPDLNHSDPSVVHRLVEWMKWTEQEFKPDGIRFDACHNSLEVCTCCSWVGGTCTPCPKSPVVAAADVDLYS